MKVQITGYHKSITCTWCDRSTEAVTVEFEDGFLRRAELCFRCLQHSIRVHHKQSKQTEKDPVPKKGS